MPNLKISQLSNGSLGQAADEFVVARAGANYKITGANVAASATSVGTLTSLTVSGNVTVNTNTFFVDTVNNRIGIGIASPTISPLQAEADADANRGLYVRNINTGTAAYGFVAAASLVGALELRAYSAASSVWPNRAVLNSGSGFTNGLAIVANGATPIEMWTNGSRRLTVDSTGNLGLGVTPSAWTGSGGTVVEIGALGNAIFGSVSLTTYAFNANFDGAWKYSRNGFASRYLQQNGTHQWFTAPSGTAGNAITFTQAMTLDASGNLGIGVAAPTTSGIDILRSSGTNAGVRMRDGTYDGITGINPTLGVMIAGTFSNHALALYANNAERVRVKVGGQVRFVPLAADPTTDVENGDVYYNSATNKLRVRAGGAWVDLH